METLAYLYIAQESEQIEAKELTLNCEFPKRTTAGLLAVTSSLGTVAITAEAASARGCCRSRPVVVRPINRCYSPCYSRGYHGGYGGYSGYYDSYYPSYGYGSYGYDDYGSPNYGYGGGSYDYSYGDSFPSAAVTGSTGALPSSILNAARPAPRPPAPTSSLATPITYSPSSSFIGGSSSVSASSSDSSLEYSGDYAGDYSTDYSTQYVYHGDDGVASFGTSGELVTASQQRLKDLGYYGGEVDGLFGPLTEHAVIEYQTNQGLRLVDGIIGPETLASLGI